VIFGVFTALFVILAVVVDRLLALPWPVPDSIGWLISAVLIVTGAAAIAWSAFHFLKVKGTPVPFNPPPKLVTTGPYRISRNPMLTGVFLLLFGIGFAINSLSLVVFFTPMYVLANVWELKKIEEPELVKRLGDDYIIYRRLTPMFIPGTKLRK
jgi:protein-S-isoprenylcysteine O-methyltransferase Ste14